MRRPIQKKPDRAGQSGWNSDRRIAIGTAFSHGQHSHKFNAVVRNSVPATIAASIASASDAVALQEKRCTRRAT
jgi:hypothetical protein